MPAKLDYPAINRKLAVEREADNAERGGAFGRTVARRAAALREAAR